jgi:hypothetical protein
MAASPAPSTSPAAVLSPHAVELARVHAILDAAGPANGGCRALPAKSARAIVGAAAPKVFDHANACVHAGGRAIAVCLAIQCEGDGCTTSTWLYTDVRPTARVPEPPLVVSPDLHFLFFDDIEFKGGGVWDSHLARRDLETQTDARFADCVSPALSPGGDWVVCRTRNDGVYRVPLAGGAPKLVVPGGPAAYWVPYAHLFPPPVEFPTAKQMSIVISSNGTTKTVPWSE